MIVAKNIIVTTTVVFGNIFLLIKNDWFNMNKVVVLNTKKHERCGTTAEFVTTFCIGVSVYNKH